MYIRTCVGYAIRVCPDCPSPTGKLLQVNTGDREVLYFEAPRGKQHFLSKEDAEEVEWATWTSVLGPSVKGVWPAYTDVTDINAACVSHDSQVIATGDDFGLVKLFQYPSYVSAVHALGVWQGVCSLHVASTCDGDDHYQLALVMVMTITS